MKLTLWVPITLVIKHPCSNDDHKKFIGGFANQDQVASKFLNNVLQMISLGHYWDDSGKAFTKTKSQKLTFTQKQQKTNYQATVW
jgi:hypothetical protein